MKRFFKKTIFIIIYILVCLFLFELSLSIFDKEIILVKSYDSSLLFTMYPNKKGKVVSEEYSVEVETNKYGFRQKINPDKKYPTLLIGDSFTEGWGVKEEEIYVQKANLLLPPDKQILNMGVHGSSPILYALQLNYYINIFKPTNVIIQLFDNDLDDNEKTERFIQFNESGIPISPKSRIAPVIFGETIYNTVKESVLYRLVSRIVKTIKKEPSPILYYKPGKEPIIAMLTHESSIQKYGKLKPLGDEIHSKYNGQFEFYVKSNEEPWISRFKKNKIYLETIASICKSHNIRLSFLYIPAKEFFAPNGITGKYNSNTLEYYNKLNPFYNHIKEICDANSLDCLYANEYFFDKNPESLYFPYDAHLNRKGHEVLSELLVEKLK